MGFRSSREADDGGEQSSSRSVQRPQQHSGHSTPGSAGSGLMAVEQAEEHYGREIEDLATVEQLQRLESDDPLRLQQWLDEGVPIEAMSDPQAIQAFRERAGTPVPWDVEQRNEQSVQRSAEATADASPAGSTQVPERVREVISSPGQSLDASIQRAMEDRMGDSLGDVRIHTGANAAAACDSIDARAFTVGNHVAFNSGEYDPSSPEGQHVLAHELAHVRQQTGGAVSMLPQEDVELEVDPDPALEREAEETAQRVLQGGELGIQRLRGTGVHVQRSPRKGPAYWAHQNAHSSDRTRPEAVPDDVELQHGAELVSAEQVVEKVENVVDEKATREYHLTRDELAALVEQVDDPAELDAYLDEQGHERTSDLDEFLDSEAMASFKIGKTAYTVAGLLALGFPKTAVAALVAGYGSKKVLEKWGDDIGEWIHASLGKHAEKSGESEAVYEGGETDDDGPWPW